MKAKNNYKLEFAIRVSGINIKASIFDNMLKRTIAILRSKANLRSKMHGGIIHLVLTDDEEIAFLNATFRGKPEHTDVISLSYFDEPEFPGEYNLVGEIMISVETAKRQANKAGISLQEELLDLFAHGLLHLFGYDHKTPKEKKEMFSLQKELLKV